MKRYKEIKKSIRIIKVIDTKHSVDRYAQRYSHLFTKEQIDGLIRKTGKQIIRKYDDRSGVYGWHSQSTNTGGIIDWRPDTYSNSDTNQAIVVSLFPPKRMHTYKDVDAKIIIENHMSYWAVETLGMSNVLKEGLGQPRAIEYLEEELPFYVTFYEGKLYEVKLDGYLIID